MSSDANSQRTVSHKEYKEVPPAYQPYMLQWPPHISASWGVSSEVNKFKQVSSNGHQMSLAGSSLGGPMSDAYGGMAMAGAGGCREVQCIMGNGFPLWTDKHERKHYFPQFVGGRWKIYKGNCSLKAAARCNWGFQHCYLWFWCKGNYLLQWNAPLNWIRYKRAKCGDREERYSQGAPYIEQKRKFPLTTECE